MSYKDGLNEISAAFLYGFISLFFITRATKVSRVRTFIHELKHFLAVILTGNRVTDFSVKKNTGHVSYKITNNTLHLEPFIVLAPYVMPLFSAPALLACLLLQSKLQPLLSLCLGAALGIDASTNFGEVHKHQTDLTTIRGGIPLSVIFIVSSNAAWLILCAVWVWAGRNGYLQIAIQIYNAAKQQIMLWIS